MKFTPRPYQERMIQAILQRKRIALFAGMGMGKTSATLEAIRRIREKRPKLKALIVAPLRVAQSTWPDELLKWDDFKHLKASVVCGNQRERIQALETDADIYTINYE
ncbi:DEAD/DEAH box helicase, partial [uncultured Parasutterella sp.]